MGTYVARRFNLDISKDSSTGFAHIMAKGQPLHPEILKIPIGIVPI